MYKKQYILVPRKGIFLEITAIMSISIAKTCGQRPTKVQLDLGHTNGTYTVGYHITVATANMYKRYNIGTRMAL